MKVNVQTIVKHRITKENRLMIDNVLKNACELITGINENNEFIIVIIAEKEETKNELA